MFKIYDDKTGELITQVEEPFYVWLNPASGAWVPCNAWQAQCVAINGKLYSLEGRPLVESAPTVVNIRWVDDPLESLRQSNDIDVLAYAIRKIAEEIVN